MGATNRKKRRAQIVASVRRVCERNGLQRASVAAIARDAGITRELFYYYFADKGEAVEAMIDDYVDECLDCARLWVESGHAGDGDGLGDTVGLVAAMRRILFDQNGNERPICGVLAELGRVEEVTARAVNEVANYLSGVTGDTAPLADEAERASTRDLIELTLVGAITLLETQPDMSDRELADVIDRVFSLL